MNVLKHVTESLGGVWRLFFPPVCPACGGALKPGSGVLCTSCRWELPLTGYWHEVDNPVVRRFWGLVPVVNACSFFFFSDGGGGRRVIHRFKYYGGWRLALDMGRWFGAELASSGLYDDVEAVVPVPLHPFKKLRRGYNQCDYLAEGIAEALGVEVCRGAVRRRVDNRSQARRHRLERWDNVAGIFAVPRPQRLAGRHILLVDDVLTTGATICSCAEALLAAVPDCRLSVATLAVSRRGLGQKD